MNNKILEMAYKSLENFTKKQANRYISTCEIKKVKFKILQEVDCKEHFRTDFRIFFTPVFVDEKPFASTTIYGVVDDIKDWLIDNQINKSDLGIDNINHGLYYILPNGEFYHDLKIFTDKPFLEVLSERLRNE